MKTLENQKKQTVKCCMCVSNIYLVIVGPSIVYHNSETKEKQKKQTVMCRKIFYLNVEKKNLENQKKQTVKCCNSIFLNIISISRCSLFLLYVT